MRKSLIALSAAAALLGAVSVANAADISGTIKSIDLSAKTVTLDNGQTFKLDTSVKAAELKVGEKVKVTYTGSGSDMQATAVAPAA